MTTQLHIDFVTRPQNSPENDRILKQAAPRLNKQCVQLLDLLQQGKSLTVKDGIMYYGIGDLRARVRDLRKAGYDVKDEMIGKGYKSYYL